MRAWRFVLWMFLVSVPMCARAGVTIQNWTNARGSAVYFVEIRGLPIVDLRVDFPAGSAYDPPGKAGLAALTWRLIDTGAGRLDEERIAEAWVDLGARFSSSVEADRGGISLRTLADPGKRDVAVNLVATLLGAPSFPAPILERERDRVLAGLREAETKPESVARRQFRAAIYPKHPYGVSATPTSVMAIARADVVDFSRRMTARSATITLVGDLSRAEAEALADRISLALPDGEVSSDLPTADAVAARRIDVPFDATQAHIYVGMAAIARGDADFFPLLLGNFIFGGGGFVSRLTSEVREKHGYAYSVHSYFDPQRQAGPFQINLQTRREQSDAALALVRQTLETFLREGPNKDELARAKRNLIQGFALRLDSNRKVLEQVATIGFYRLPLDWLDRFPERVAAVSAREIRDAFRRRVRPEQMVTLVLAGGDSSSTPSANAPSGPAAVRSNLP